MECNFAKSIFGNEAVTEGGGTTPPRLLVNGNSETITTPYNIHNAMKNYWSSPQYNYHETSTKDSFATCVERNINAGYPIIVQIKITDTTYFNYTSNGHFVLVVGFYEELGNKMLIINDPHYDINKGKQLKVSIDKIYEYLNEHSRYFISAYS